MGQINNRFPQKGKDDTKLTSKSSKKFLDEDFKWAEENSEDAISLLSAASESSKLQKYLNNEQAKE